MRRAGGGGGDAVLDACVRACVSMLGESMPCDYSQLACTLGLGCQTDGQSNARQMVDNSARVAEQLPGRVRRSVVLMPAPV